MSTMTNTVGVAEDPETGELLFYSDRDPLSLSVRHFSFVGRKPGEVYRCIKIRHGLDELEVYASPTGRSVRFFVNGIEVTTDGEAD